jgi:hypothetical protein
LLLLALFLPPLGLYLIVLGWINRRPRPVMASGTWDFAGVLFAVSGFVLAGGPALLGSLDEQSRLFWLLGETEPARAGGGNGAFWIAIRLLYFAVVAGGAAFLLWRSRRLTSVYNVDSRTALAALEQAFRRLGLSPLRSGDSFLIGGRAVETTPKTLRSEGIQVETESPGGLAVPLPAEPVVLGLNGEPAALQVDAFPLMRHVTLGWDPADSPLRCDLERELARILAEASPPEQEPILGWMLSMAGVALILFALFGAAFVVLHNLLPR